MYWAKDTQNKIFNGATDEEIQDAYDNYLEVSEDEVPLSYNEFKANFGSSLDRILLDLEKEILLHPRNAHHLLMPLTDEIFVKDIYDDLKKEGLIKEPSKSYTGAILPSTNVKNTTIFVKGKGGVGPVALAITNSGTNQADTLTISKEYRNNEGNIVPTKLLFQHMGDVYSLDNYTDNKGTVISEILSQLLTTQVDNVKNPTAVLMNINMQTLGVILYLIRRKINPKSIVLFLQQPIITKYLQYQRQNESLFNKQTNTEDSAKELLVRLKRDLYYSDPEENLPDVYEVVEGKSQFEISDAEMLRNAKEGKFDNRQLEYLSYFRDLQAQSRAFSDFQQTQNSDTKGLKDKQMLDESEVVFQRAFANGIIDPDDITRLNETGVISPFFKYGRNKYKIYNQFYGLASSAFRDLLFDFKNDAASIAKSTAKDRVRQTIENDFMLFLIHRYVTTKDEFDRLMKGDSVAKRVRDLKIKLPGNLVLKAFFPMLSNTVDRTTDTKIDNLRLFEKELNSLDNNDLSMSLEEIADTDIDLYNDIVKLLMFQTGLNISPFNYRSVIPVGLNKSRSEFNEYQYLYQDMLKEAMVKMKQEFGSRINDNAEKAFNDFKLLFAANNPQFLRDNFYHPLYPYKLVRVWDRQTKSFILKPQKGNQTQIQLGDAYQKQYFRELINPNLFTVKQEQPEAKNILNNVFDEEIEYTPYEEVVEKPLALPEGEKKDENIPFDEIPEVGDMSDYQSVFELDQSSSMYSPSLKMYEGFININELYRGDEILPFIGESEYYRYLVPMLLKMNPDVTTVFINNMHDVVFKLLNREQLDNLSKVGKLPNGVSIASLNTNLISFNGQVSSRTVVHELVHRTIQKEYEKGGDFKQKIDELYKYAWDRQPSDRTYGFTSTTEFLAEALANPGFMEELNNIQYKEETVWTYLMTLVSDFINNLLNIELKSDSVLAEVVRLSEQVLNKNLSEVSKEKKVTLSEFQQEIVNNWNNYFPDYLWMNDAQREMTAKLAEEGKIQLNCKI